MLDILKSYSNNNVLVIGDVMLDEYVFGDSKPSKNGVNIFNKNSTIPIEYTLGGAGNVFHNSFNMGSSTKLIGILGVDVYGYKISDFFRTLGNENNTTFRKNYFKDKFGKTILQNCRMGTYDTNLLSMVDGYETTVKSYFIDSKNEIQFRLDSEQTSSFKCNSDLFETDIDFFLKTYSNKAIIISDYNKGVVTDPLLKYINKKAKDCFITVDVNPVNYKTYHNLDKIDLMKITLDDALKIVDKENYFSTGKVPDTITAKLYRIFKNVKCLVITADCIGLYATENMWDMGREIHVKPHIIDNEVVNTIGAGDVIVASLTNSLMSNPYDKKIFELASICASEVIKEKITGKINYESLLKQIN